MSKIMEAIVEFRTKILAETGRHHGVVKIGLHPEVFDQLCYEVAENTKFGFPTIRDIGSPMRIADVDIVRKLPEDF